MTLRLKLLLAASVLLVVPLAGYRFVLAMENFLRADQVHAASATARVFAAALESRPALLPLPPPGTTSGPHLHVYPLAAAPEVDGYQRDWEGLAAAVSGGPPLLAASQGNALFLLLRLPAANSRPNAPRVRLLLEDSASLVRAWLLAPTVPGAFTPMEVPPAPGSTYPAHPDARISAAMQRSGDAILYEVRMPLALVSPRLGFEILTGPGSNGVPRSGTYRLSLPPEGLSALLDRLAAHSRGRVRVTDLAGRVLAQAGVMETDARAGDMAGFLEELLGNDEDALLSIAPATLALAGTELSAALAGEPAARLRRGDAGAPLVVSAAHPLRRGAQVVGALVLEQSTSPIQALGRRALLELLAAASFAFLVGSIVVLSVAGRAASRLRALRDRAADAVDVSGRVHQSFHALPGQDEIGDLGRSFEATVNRLQGYQHYLEQLAQRLSHELRTPLAVIRSSLDNLAMNPADSGQKPFIERAHQGVERLDGLIRRMSEATRLEQAMADTDTCLLDLRALLEGAVAAHAQAHPLHPVALQADSGPIRVRGSAELLLQAVDKLLDNARDFALGGSTIRVCVRRGQRRVSLTVENDGPPLPAGQQQRLFDSMVGQRSGATAGNGPHLGLGLYIVRLVAEFHGGRPVAANLETGNGVAVGMKLPLASDGD